MKTAIDPNQARAADLVLQDSRTHNRRLSGPPVGRYRPDRADGLELGITHLGPTGRYNIQHMTQTAPETSTRSASPAAFLRLLRPHHWSKNVLVFAPYLFRHDFSKPELLWGVCMAFVCFCMAASAGYVFNDLKDVQSDRTHPTKRNRPLASGAVSLHAAWLIAPVLMVGAFAIGLLFLPMQFVLCLGFYVAGTIAYSAYLKTRLLVDVMVLVALYIIRMMAGGAATGIELTPWLLGTSMFLFLSLAFAKRFAELSGAASDDVAHVKARNYRQEDLETLAAVGPASGYMAVVVLSLYIGSEQAARLYHRPMLLWLVCPVILYWITRLWFFARRGVLNEDPIAFALKDRISWVAMALICVLGVLAVMT